MSTSPIAAAIKQIVDEKGIPMEVVIETVEAALAAAFRKDFGQPNQNIVAKFNVESGATDVVDVKTVVADELKAEWERAVAEAKERQAAGIAAPKREEMPTEAVVADDKPHYHPRLHLTVTEAQAVKPGAVEGEEIVTPLTIPAAFGRMAAQTAKQVIVQKLREATRTILFEEFKGREGEILPGTIQRRLGPNYLVDLGRATGILPPEDQMPRDRYMPGTRLTMIIRSVFMGPKGPEIVLSRSHPDLVRGLFVIEIPEIANGSVEIMGVAREAGDRVKVAVRSMVANVDPIGSCVGQRGSRVQTIISELGGEKIDIIEWSENAETFIRNALSPAKVSSVALDEPNKTATVHADETQLSLAIGRGGQNVRLATQLTGWKIGLVGMTPTAVEGTGETAAPTEGMETVQPETDASAPDASTVDLTTTPSAT